MYVVRLLSSIASLLKAAFVLQLDELSCFFLTARLTKLILLNSTVLVWFGLYAASIFIKHFILIIRKYNVDFKYK